MNYKMIVWGIFMAAVSFVNSQSDNSSFENEKSQAIRAVSNGINQFSVEFYEAIAKDATGNIVCSPLSAAMVLMMAAYGAQNKTAQEMNSALHSGGELNKQKTGIQSLIDQLNAVKKVELRLANKIFVASGMNIKDEFKATTELTFRSVAQSLNFTANVLASEEINGWCAENTNSKIKDIVQPGDLGPDTALLLVNAVYFKGNWANKFDKNDTKVRPFIVDESTTKNVSMMHRLGNYRYGVLPEISAKFIEIPYESTDLSDAISMIIILPDEINGLAKVEENLHKVSLARLLMGEEYEVSVYMPKFKIESKTDLKDVLYSMGMKEMFNNNANFTGIVDAPPLKISKIIQKAFIEVNEEGSEAAAVTEIEIENRIGYDEHPKKQAYFNVNHPFLMLITSEDVIVFGARIVDATL